MEHISKVRIDFLDRICIARMEWHGDHWLDRRKINLDQSVIVGYLTRIQFFKLFTSAMDLIKLFDLLICTPDGRQTCCFCCHDINPNSEISGKSGNTRSDKFHDFILHIAIGKYRTDDRKRYVLRTDAFDRCTL